MYGVVARTAHRNNIQPVFFLVSVVVMVLGGLVGAVAAFNVALPRKVASAYCSPYCCMSCRRFRVSRSPSGYILAVRLPSVRA